MKFGFILKHRLIWPGARQCGALTVLRSGFHAWLNLYPQREMFWPVAYHALHKIERLMRVEALRAKLVRDDAKRSLEG